MNNRDAMKWAFKIMSLSRLQTHLEGREWHIDTVGVEACQNQLVDLMAYRHTVTHLSGVNTQLENLNPLLQIHQEDFRCRVVDHQRAAMRGGKQDLCYFFAVHI